MRGTICSLSLILSLLFSAVPSHATPLRKRIAQTISDSTTQWEQACLAAGGADQCNPTSVTAFSTLLAGAGNCDQQNAADSMIDLAKQLNNDATMIQLTQIFMQQARNSPNSLSVPYCDQAPKNSELNGLFQCQFQGVSTTFVGNLQPGAAGTIPFGLSSPVNPPRSCPAHTSGGIPDGSQLISITQDPGVGNSTSGSSSSGSGTGSNTSSITVPASSTFAPSTSAATVTVTVTASGDCDATPSASATGTSDSVTSSSTSSFALQNGKDAQQLNAKFATLTANSTCTSGEDACVGTSFAQCANGAFAVTECAGGLICAALPLVNSAGTSVACTTQQDALSRIAATGATGGLTGSD